MTRARRKPKIDRKLMKSQRAALGWTQDDLAFRVCSKRYIQKIEKTGQCSDFCAMEIDNRLRSEFDRRGLKHNTIRVGESAQHVRSSRSQPLVSSDELKAFGVTFPGHRVEMWFGPNAGGGVPLEDIECLPDVGDIQPLTGELLTARELYTRAKEEDAHRKGKQFDDNALLGAASWCPARIDASGTRRRFARLGFRRVSYFDHIFLGEGLNRDISDWLNKWIPEGGVRDNEDLFKRVKSFVRSNPRFVPAERLEIDTEHLELGHAPKWPMIPFRVGLAVVIVTADEPPRVIVPLRSNQVYLGNRSSSVGAGAYSSSVGEGMARGDTVRGLHLLRLEGARERRRKGQRVRKGEEGHHQLAASKAPDTPSLVTLAARGLLDEMGIEDQVDCDVAHEVLCVALNLDRHEGFPHISTVLKTRLTFDEVMELRLQKAKDTHVENKIVLGLRWDEKMAEGLARGEFKVEDFGKIVAASVRERIFFAQAADALPPIPPPRTTRNTTNTNRT